MSLAYSKIAGLGICVPERVLSNAELETMVDTSDEWIVSHTGIRERRVVAEGQATTDLATEAAKAALSDAGMEAADVDAVLLATITPDHHCPASACQVQYRLGAGGFAFDLAAGCTGWLYGLSIADALIASGRARNVLCIGTECLTRITNWKDRNTCVLFGDGGGAAVVTRAESEAERGILAWDLGSDGEDPSILWQPAGGSRTPVTHEAIDAGTHLLDMRGKDVFKFAARIMGHTCDRTLERAGVTSDQVALLVPHQANERSTVAAQRRFSMPAERVMSNIAKYGNTSSASVPIALREALDEGRAKTGDLILLVAFGAGLTWGSMLVRWTR